MWPCLRSTDHGIGERHDRPAVGDAFAALTGRDIRIANARARRRPSGLRRAARPSRQAISELSGGGSPRTAEDPGGRVPSRPAGKGTHVHLGHWLRGVDDDAHAGGAAGARLRPGAPIEAEIVGGVFQDFAPSYFHLERRAAVACAPWPRRTVEPRRPGYVPSGGGLLRVSVRPAAGSARPLALEPSALSAESGASLLLRLLERRVRPSHGRSGEGGTRDAGYSAGRDRSALRRNGAAARRRPGNLRRHVGRNTPGCRSRRRLRRSAEAIGKYAARHLLEDLRTGAAVDRHAADQLISYAALADGESRFRIPAVTEHLLASAWLVREFLDADVRIDDNVVTVQGVGLRRRADAGTVLPAASELRREHDECDDPGVRAA